MWRLAKVACSVGQLYNGKQLSIEAWDRLGLTPWWITNYQSKSVTTQTKLKPWMSSTHHGRITYLLLSYDYHDKNPPETLGQEASQQPQAKTSLCRCFRWPTSFLSTSFLEQTNLISIWVGISTLPTIAVLNSFPKIRTQVTCAISRHKASEEHLLVS